MANKEQKLYWLEKAKSSLQRQINSTPNQMIREIFQKELIELTEWMTEINKTTPNK